jgi:hypothetical protein
MSDMARLYAYVPIYAKAAARKERPAGSVLASKHRARV